MMARPPTFGTPATAAIRIRVTPAQRQTLEAVAHDNHTTVAGVIRDAVNGYVADYRDGPPVFPFRGPKLGA